MRRKSKGAAMKAVSLDVLCRQVYHACGYAVSADAGYMFRRLQALQFTDRWRR